MKSLRSLAVCLFLFLHISLALSSYASDYWPTTDWRTRNLAETGVDEQRFEEFLDYVFNRGKFDTLDDCLVANEEENKDFQTNALIVVKDGYLIYERYACGFTRKNKHLLWSISKSITATLVGIAQKNQYIHTDEYVRSYIEVPVEETWEKMKIDDLLHMSSGIEWREVYDESPTESDVINTIYGRGSNDIINYILKRPLSGSLPGERFYYSTGDTAILTHVLNQALGGEDAFLEFFRDELLTPLGITDYTVESDMSGHFYGGDHIYLNSRDLAKIGLLYMHRGYWEDRQLFSHDWYNYTISPAPAWFENNPDDKEIYGAHWWLNLDTVQQERPFPFVPEDAFFAIGHYGQLLGIIPSLNLIVVRNGWDSHKEIDMGIMQKLLIRSFQ